MKNTKTKKQIRNAALSSRDFARPAPRAKLENSLFSWIETAQERNYAILKTIARRYTPARSDAGDLVHHIALVWPASAKCPDEQKVLAYFTTACRRLGYKLARHHVREPELNAMGLPSTGADRLAFDGESIPAVEMAEEIFRDARNTEELREGLGSLVRHLHASRTKLPGGLAGFLAHVHNAADLYAALTQATPQVPMAKKLGLSQGMYSKYVRQAAAELAPAARRELLR